VRVCVCQLNFPIHPVTFIPSTRGFHVADDTYVWLLDTFRASHQQAGEGQADKMVHSVPTEAEGQGMHISPGFQSTCSVFFFFAGAFSCVGWFKRERLNHLFHLIFSWKGHQGSECTCS
jgi:hypothetical protein